MGNSVTGPAAYIQSTAECTARGHWSPAGLTVDQTIVVREGVWSQTRGHQGTSLVVVDGLARVPEALTNDVAGIRPASDRVDDSVGTVVAALHKAFELLSEACPPGTDAWATCTEASHTKVVLTAAGQARRHTEHRSYLMVEVAGSTIPPLHRVRRSHTAAATLDRMCPDIVSELVAAATAQARLVSAAGPPPAGRLPVVLSPAASATFIHEVVGHLLEGDLLAREGSPYSGRLGHRVASEDVRVVDDGTNTMRWAGAPFDDEGVDCRATTLIHDGVLVDSLCATACGPGSTGNGRRLSHRHRVVPRMTQTMLAPGTHTSAELIESVHDGLYVSDISWGKVNPGSGAFELMPRQAQLIRDGELAEHVVGGVLAGDSRTALRSIEAMADDLAWSSGLCIKQAQELPIATGGPTTLVRELEVRPS